MKTRTRRPKPPRESEVQAAFVETLELFGCRAHRRNAGKLRVPGRNGKVYYVKLAEEGAADLFGVFPDGRHYDLEVKRPGERPDLHQVQWLREANRWAPAFWCDDVDKLKEWLPHLIAGASIVWAEGVESYPVEIKAAGRRRTVRMDGPSADFDIEYTPSRAARGGAGVTRDEVEGQAMQPTLFDAERRTLGEAIETTAASLSAYGPTHRHWAIAYSGGKDSTALATVVLKLLKMGAVPPPERLTVCYADTRMELPPLAAAASRLLDAFRAEGVEVRVALPPLDDRFFVYMLGRGVPPPTNRFRWCTGQIKVEPMEAALRGLYEGSKILMLTGVRQGESAARDGRIAISCGKDGAECGQGWYQETLPEHLCDTLAPILHWRVCHVWDWLANGVEKKYRHGYETGMVASAYGLGEEGSRVEKNARTGCNGCPLATKDAALDNLLRSARWKYLEPLKELRPLYRWLREPAQRLRKPGREMNKAGAVRYTNRMGPLTFEARTKALDAILSIQARVNEAAGDMPTIDMLDAEEEARIRELVAAGTWPNRWTGDEPTGDVAFERVHADGSIQREMFGG